MEQGSLVGEGAHTPVSTSGEVSWAEGGFGHSLATGEPRKGTGLGKVGLEVTWPGPKCLIWELLVGS